MKELKKLINEYNDVKTTLDDIDVARKKTKENLNQLSAQICDYFVDNGIEKNVTIDGFEISATYKPQYTIQGGETKYSEKREEFLEDFKALGYDNGKIEMIHTIRKNSFQACMKKIPSETISKWIDDGYISVWNKPNVTMTTTNNNE
jgi:hypothetical protein